MLAFLVFVVFLLLAGVSGWGFASTQAEISRRSLSRRSNLEEKFAVDPYVWSKLALPRLRRRYVLTQACFPPAALCLGALVWMKEPSEERAIFGAMAFGAVAVFSAVNLAWKVRRHGL